MLEWGFTVDYLLEFQIKATSKAGTARTETITVTPL